MFGGFVVKHRGSDDCFKEYIAQAAPHLLRGPAMRAGQPLTQGSGELAVNEYHCTGRAPPIKGYGLTRDTTTIQKGGQGP